MYRQFELRSDDHRLTCWLADDSRIHEGTLVRLDGEGIDPDRWWHVARKHNVRVTHPPDKTWKVGGLL